jgi:hydroxymethylbilane synthase
MDDRQSSTIATGSPRRRCALKARRSDIRVTNLRGNVQTRIQKLADADWAGIILAAAGVERLGIKSDSVFDLPATGANGWIPACGQGAVAIQTRCGDAALRASLVTLNHLPTWHAVLAERAVLRTLRAGCHAPIGAFAHWVGEGDARLTLWSKLWSMDGRRICEAELSALVTDDTTADALGVTVAEMLRARGSDLIFDLNAEYDAREQSRE